MLGGQELTGDLVGYMARPTERATTVVSNAHLTQPSPGVQFLSLWSLEVTTSVIQLPDIQQEWWVLPLQSLRYQSGGSQEAVATAQIAGSIAVTATVPGQGLGWG